MSLINLDGGAAPEETMFLALVRAEDRLSRLDERAKLSGFVEGWRARADVRATQAAAWLEGFLVHPEDLILYDLGADARTPELDVVRAGAVLRARRKARRDPGSLLSWRGVLWLLGRAETPPTTDRPSVSVGSPLPSSGVYEQLESYLRQLSRGSNEEPRRGVEECLAVFDALGPRAPATLSAALFLEAWRLVDPLPTQRWVGFLLAEIWLVSEQRFSAGVAPLEIGFRRRGQMAARLAWGPVGERLAWWLDGMGLACDLELEEIGRLKTKLALIERRLVGRRSNSRARALVNLALGQAVVSTPIIVEALKITPQAARQLVASLGDGLQEITGRSRYQVWRL